MVGALTILNPIGKKKSRRKGPRRMSAKQAKFFAPKGTKKKAARRAAAVHTNTIRSGAMAHKKKHRKHKRRAMKRNPLRLRFKRNPISASGFMEDTFMPAAIGVGGALAVDIIMGNFPVPPAWKTGMAATVTRIAAAIGVGLLITELSGEKAGAQATAGGMVTAMYALAKPYLLQTMPNLNLSRYMTMGAVRRPGRRGMRGMGATPRLFRPQPNLGNVIRMQDVMTRQGMRGNVNAQSRMRQGRGGLGFIGPARQLGMARYMQQR